MQLHRGLSGPIPAPFPDCHEGKFRRPSSRSWRPPPLVHLGPGPGPALYLDQSCLDPKERWWRSPGLSSRSQAPVHSPHRVERLRLREGQPQQGRKRNTNGQEHLTKPLSPSLACLGSPTPGQAGLLESSTLGLPLRYLSGLSPGLVRASLRSAPALTHRLPLTICQESPVPARKLSPHLPCASLTQTPRKDSLPLLPRPLPHLESKG